MCVRVFFMCYVSLPAINMREACWAAHSYKLRSCKESFAAIMVIKLIELDSKK